MLFDKYLRGLEKVGYKWTLDALKHLQRNPVTIADDQWPEAPFDLTEKEQRSVFDIKQFYYRKNATLILESISYTSGIIMGLYGSDPVVDRHALHKSAVSMCKPPSGKRRFWNSQR